VKSIYEERERVRDAYGIAIAQGYPVAEAIIKVSRELEVAANDVRAYIGLEVPND
jgi:hypothetical protein